MNRSEILAKLAAGELSVAQATSLLESTGAGEQASDPDGGDTDPIRASVGHTAQDVESGSEDFDATASQQDTPHLSANRAGMQTGADSATHRAGSKRKLHIDVIDNDRSRVRVVLPFGLLRAGLWLGSKFDRRVPAHLWEAMEEALEYEDQWTLVHVEDGRDKVHIYVE